jgi:predicted DNA-binding helix-hairpin-helix protein
MPFDQGGNLPLEVDPKLAWAESHLRHAPVEVNTADRRQLMQIPGIGPLSASAIQKNRRLNKIASLGDLKKLGIRAEQAAPFILLNGARPAHQLTFF